MKPIIEIDSCKVQYGTRVILDIDNIFLNEGDVVAVIGENGAGKTTFVKAILNLISYQGEIKINLPFSSIGISMQTNEFHELMKVKEVVAIFLDKCVEEIAESELAATFKITELLNKKISVLSGGELQRLTLFLVVYKQPALLICDEPTTGLDTQTRVEIMKYLKSVFIGRSGIIISHYFQEIKQVANKILILNKGKALFYGSIPDYLENFKNYVIYSNEVVIEKEGIPVYKELYSDDGEKIIIIDNSNENIQKIIRNKEQMRVKAIGLKEAYLLHMEKDIVIL